MIIIACFKKSVKYATAICLTNIVIITNIDNRKEEEYMILKIIYYILLLIVNIYSIKNVSIIDYAEVSANPYNISLLKQVVLMLLVGLVLSMAVVFVMFYFDTTIKSTEEIETKIGLPTLGVVPIKYVPKDKKGKRK